MESVHGVDVSWMSKHSSAGNTRDTRPHASHSSSFPPHEKKPSHNGNGHPAEAQPAVPKPIPRPQLARSSSTEKTTTPNGSHPKSVSPSHSPSRKNSWLSSISSKFSSSPSVSSSTHNASVTPSPQATAGVAEEPLVPTGPQSPKNAVLPHAVKPTGDVPYIPAPPKSTQPNFLQSALRRLSGSGGQLQAPQKAIQNVICERRVLNVDHNRERCHITELDAGKLRRVAFCVDVEIASGPRYMDEKEGGEKGKEEAQEKKRAPEKGGAGAFKNPEVLRDGKQADGVVAATGERIGEVLPIAESKGTETTTTEANEEAPFVDNTRKKEKKKRSEEERKARKEKKRKLAEANGTVPVELVRNASDSSGAAIPVGTGASRTQASPTTDPVRIYRRCCQLRETPILKRITEQLTDAGGRTPLPGVISKLDLTGYWLQLPDLVTLGDYLAVVPVKELIMENCGLSDEGVRVILAGLLAAKPPDWESTKSTTRKWGEVPQGGVVERIVFKNNVKIARDGWRYISTFIAMCRTLKSMDLSQVPFPQPIAPLATPPGHTHAHGLHLNLTRTTSSTVSRGSTVSNPETSCVFGKAIGERLAGKEFELLNLAECGLSTEQLGCLIDGVIKSGLRRLGIAGNHITPEGMQHVVRYVRQGKCEGLDLGGNDLRDQLGVIAMALDENSPLYALSLADCNLTPDSLWSLFPALAKLKNFRFIDLSQNHGLFDAEPSAISLLRRYLPRIPTLKRIHLTDVSMTSEQAIALAEILPESPNLAHVNIMENPGLAALANAKEEANQEEACALYASLMAAVRVSQSIICIDIEVPSADSSDVVKALAKQVVAYCLWNMERGPVAEISDAAAAITEPHGGEKEVAVPDVLLHLVGHVEGVHSHDEDESAPDEDYVIGGTGVVKALGICLRNRVNDCRRASADPPLQPAEGGSGSATPRAPVEGGKAKDMSKNLLGSARKIRARLQPALVKESRGADRQSYMRLLFLDQTLEGMIKRFEDEYPETRLPSSPASPPIPDLIPGPASPASSTDLATTGPEADTDAHLPEPSQISDDEDPLIRPMLSRRNSDVSIASRALAQEEGRMHRFGQQFRRDMLKPESGDHQHGAPGLEEQAKHPQLLRAVVEGLGGEEIRSQIVERGDQAVLEQLRDEASVLKYRLIQQDPEAWEQFCESQEAALRNQKLEGVERDVSVIE
ncbi:cell wall biogenesis protein Mhp1 [Diplocarpon rosae]|nr:cell wall biogenesis protein Mhp1 [Diplocarpon rosae]